jgi:hypothetical protein
MNESFLNAKHRLGNGPEMDEFYKDIKDKLVTKEADPVLDAFVDYVDAAMAATRARLVLSEHTGHPDWQGFLRSVAINVERQTARFRSLLVLVYGERVVDGIETGNLDLYDFISNTPYHLIENEGIVDIVKS